MSQYPQGQMMNPGAMSQYTQSQMMNPGAMSANGSDPNNPSYNPNSGAPPAPSANNGYPSYNNYAPPPQSHGYYNNQYPSQFAPAPAGLYGPPPPPPPPYYYQAPVAPPQNPRKPTVSKGSKRTSYNASRNRVSGNRGDNNGVFNLGNKN